MNDRRGWLPSSLFIFLLLLLSLTAICLASTLAFRLLGFGIPWSYAYYYVPHNFGSDFKEFGPRFGSYGKPSFMTWGGYFMYPAPLASLIHVFYLSSHPTIFYLGFICATVFFMATCFLRILRRAGLSPAAAGYLVAGVTVTSYPLLFVLQRWNVEVAVWLFVSLGLWAFIKEKYAWAAVMLGAATSLKLYPFIFFGLFLPRRRYLGCGIGVLTYVVITVFSLYGIDHNIARAYHWNSIQLQAFSRLYAASLLSLGYDHSIFGLLKAASLPWLVDLTPVVRPYTVLVALSCLVLYFTRIWQLPLLNQVLVLSILSVIVAPVSFDYTLLSLYPGLAMLCVYALHTPASSQQRLIPLFTLFALVLTPESYIIVNNARFCGQFRAVCLLTLLYLSLRDPLKYSFTGEPGYANEHGLA